jgi:hypothetical protein
MNKLLCVAMLVLMLVTGHVTAQGENDNTTMETVPSGATTPTGHFITTVNSTSNSNSTAATSTAPTGLLIGVSVFAIVNL